MTRLLQINKFVVGPLATNCYLVHGREDKKGMLIDPAACDPEIKRSIKAGGIDVLCTLNTHGHADHIAGDAAFGYPVYIHELDEPCLSDARRNLSFMTGSDVTPPVTGKLLRDGDIIDIGGIRFEVIHTPGHTPGGICLRCGDVLFSGDTLFYEGVGRTDAPGGDHEALIRSIRERLMALPDTVRVFPGHGPETTIGHERRCNGFL